MTQRSLVIIVEDDASMRRALARFLSAAGYRIADFESAEAALVSAAVDGACCLVTDVQLPAMSGFDLSTAMRRSHPHLSTVFLTAYDSRDFRAKAAACADSAYLAKPFEPSDLLRAVTALSRDPR